MYLVLSTSSAAAALLADALAHRLFVKRAKAVTGKLAREVGKEIQLPLDDECVTVPQ
jgi:hypothetical protein